MTYRTIRFRKREKRGHSRSWGEWQVVEGEKILARYDELARAERDYPDAIVEETNK